MAPEVPLPTADERRTALEVVRTHPAREALGALVFDAVRRQAEGRTLYGGRAFVEALLAEHGLRREQTATPLGDVAEMLESGPKDGRGWALLAALAVVGLDRALDGSDSAERDASIVRFAHHCDWLELATPLVPSAFVDELLAPDAVRRLVRAWTQGVLETADESDGPHTLARNAARLARLAASRSTAAQDALDEVAATAQSPANAALARALGGRDAARSESFVGRPGRAPPTGWRRVVSWASGWTLLRAVGRLLGWLTGLRRDARVAIEGRRIRWTTRVSWLGRTVRESTRVLEPDAVRLVSCERRWPLSHAVIGALGLCAGVLVGGLLAADAVRTGETWLLVAAAAWVAGGALLDVLLDTRRLRSRARASVELVLSDASRLRLDGLADEQAARLHAALLSISRHAR
ncbi:MAG: hypothetical protein NZ898_12780 [Myxococcota bacterium]|nr:hypothetical protein [Myxococcota bacterium]MDW8361024.1 hypothetical protein [Myxococcales bacterium]